jgi:hypothetical protein
MRNFANKKLLRFIKIFCQNVNIDACFLEVKSLQKAHPNLHKCSQVFTNFRQARIFVKKKLENIYLEEKLSDVKSTFCVHLRRGKEE